jgi:hypothetical protein
MTSDQLLFSALKLTMQYVSMEPLFLVTHMSLLEAVRATTEETKWCLVFFHLKIEFPSNK